MSFKNAHVDNGDHSSMSFPKTNRKHRVGLCASATGLCGRLNDVLKIYNIIQNILQYCDLGQLRLLSRVNKQFNTNTYEECYWYMYYNKLLSKPPPEVNYREKVLTYIKNYKINNKNIAFLTTDEYISLYLLKKKVIILKDVGM